MLQKHKRSKEDKREAENKRRSRRNKKYGPGRINEAIEVLAIITLYRLKSYYKKLTPKRKQWEQLRLDIQSMKGKMKNAA